MVLADRAPQGCTGVAPAPDPGQTRLIPGTDRWATSCLAPNEHLAGAPEERAYLAERLAARRASGGLERAHPDLTFSLLPWVLGSLPRSGPALEIFRAGTAALAARYAQLGLDHLLPIDRVWVGIRSGLPGAFGGFHHPDQGYRHQQMGSLVTRYGGLTQPALVSPGLVALDLLRSYAHDCLHYGSFREYRLWDGQIVRTRYGINRRDRQGCTYSAPDAAGTATTRNLGIIMEGAIDHEARALACQAAAQTGSAEPEGAVDRLAFRDATGRLSVDDSALLSDPLFLKGVQSTDASGYLASTGSYERRVGIRYRGFLTDMGGHQAEGLHALILKATISGEPG